MLLALTACLVVIASFAAALAARAAQAATRSAAAAKGAQEFTLYSVATQRQTVNQADGRARGEGNNPFGNYASAGATPPTDEKIFGPFPTDWGEYALTFIQARTARAAPGRRYSCVSSNFNRTPSAMRPFS